MMATAARDRDFTLIELLIAIAIMLIMAAMAIPASVRTINSSQYAFTASCGFGFYAPSLTVLATPPTAAVGSDGFVGSDLATDPSTKSSYSIALTPGALATQSPPSCNGVPAGGLVWTYFVAATPLPGGGTRYFAINQGGTVHQAPVPIPVTQSGAPPGTTVVQ